jgi:hypothetical protein
MAFNTSMVQGPGTMDAMEQIATADSRKRPGLVKQALGQIYAHPLRNTMFEYALTPWNIANASQKGLAWKGIYGYRGFAKPQTGISGLFSAPTAGLRKLIGGVGHNLFGGGASSSAWKMFGNQGFEGLATAAGAAGHGRTAKIMGALGSVLGGTSANMGKLGYTAFGKMMPAALTGFGPGTWSSLDGGADVYTQGAKITALDAANQLGGISKKYGGVGGFWQAMWNEQKFVNKVSGALSADLGVTLSTAETMAKPWVRGLKATRIMGGAATLALWWDIGKFAATNTYKIARFGLEKANMALAGAARQDWGSNVSQSFITSGATTERQRALDEIGRSSMNGRSLLGNEAGMAARTFVGGRSW